ncbi:MAG: spore germination protein [Bacillota bacterium]
MKNTKYKKIPPLEQKLQEVESQGMEGLSNARFSQKLDDNINSLQGVFKNCFDFVVRRVNTADGALCCAVCYIDAMVVEDIINEHIVSKISSMNVGEMSLQNKVAAVKNNIIAAGNMYEVDSLPTAVNHILSASCLILVDGYEYANEVFISGMEKRSISEPKVEAVVRGPQDAFNEDMITSVTLIRRRLKTHKLKFELLQLGRQSKTKIVLAYVEGIAERKTVREMKKRLVRIDTDMILASGQLQPFVEDDHLSPFPQVELTERPDTVTAALIEGRLALIVDGTPFVLIAPTSFTYLFTSAEDYYNRYTSATFIRLLRYAAFGITIFGPSLYVAITTYHPEMIPTRLLMTIANARADVPFPAFIEAFLMELIFEVIREASIRQPKTLGQALNIVGALVIGQLSVQAGLVSPAMIIVVAVTGIASFLIPKFNSAREISLIRFPMMVLAGVLGIFGVIIGILILLIHLTSLRSIGVPYMAPLTPMDFAGMKDAILKFPERLLKRRPDFIQKNNIVRRKGVGNEHK